MTPNPFANGCPSALQRSLAELETFANSTTKQLDDSYYSVLAKLTSLQNTIAALRELAEASHQLNNSFTADADELVTDINSQLDAFGQFEDQQQRIESLQSRIHAGRDLIRSLSERVDAVSERIESWERADKEWQERTRRRLMVIWGITSAVIFVLALLYYGAQYRASGSLPLDRLQTGDISRGEGLSGMNGSLNASSSGMPVADVEAGDEPFPDIGKPEPKGGDADERLRLFDEL